MSQLVIGHTEHCRFEPKKHHFKYPLYMIDVDLHQLEQLNQTKWLGYNQRRLLSIYDEDYLHLGPMSLAEKVQIIAPYFSNKSPITQVQLVTIPRLILNTFRPVSFYLCYTDQNTLIGMIAEVTNTYKESYFYVVEPNGDATRMSVDKAFHVSPFFEEQGQYHFRIKNTPTQFEVHIEYTRDEKPLFYANFIGKKHPINTLNILRLLLFYPLTAVLVFPRILAQAFQLSVFKKIKHYSKPKLKGEHMLRPMELNWLQKKALHRLQSQCQTLSSGHLTIRLPNQQEIHLGQDSQGSQAELNISNTHFFSAIQKGGEMGLGESYMKGMWDSPSLAKVIGFMIENKDQLEQLFKGSFWLKRFNIWQHRRRKNSTQTSKRNIADHYDLGNDFYQLFLDKSMMYSSALYNEQTTNLTDAQEQKVNRLLSQLALKPGDHVLEIGSGWGYVAQKIAQKYQCKVTTITLSEEQKRHIESEIKDSELSNLIQVQLIDYRHIQGQFDAIISIEMLEAVGHQYLSKYFESCNRLLKKGGRLALQCITYPNEHYHRYIKGTDFIRKHIFPGGHLPSLDSIQEMIDTQTSLIQKSHLNIADSYAKTLATWHESFNEQIDRVKSLGFNEEFIRKWRYYLAYCEAAFASNYLGCYQLSYQKQGD